MIVVGWKLIPHLLARVEKTCNEEISLLLALTICLVVAAITEAVGLSLALGAFVGGMLLGSSDYAHRLASQTLPLREVFVAIFFVSVGLLINPSTWFSNWQLIAVLVAIVLLGKFVIWFLIVRLFGYGTQTALRVGIGLTQIGESSFILAQVSLHSKLVGSDVYNSTLAASVITILVNAALFKLVKPMPAAKLEAGTS